MPSGSHLSVGDCASTRLSLDGLSDELMAASGDGMQFGAEPTEKKKMNLSVQKNAFAPKGPMIQRSNAPRDLDPQYRRDGLGVLSAIKIHFSDRPYRSAFRRTA
jgi:hypothetical protein